MSPVVSYIEYLNLPAVVGMVIAAVFLIIQIIGGILDFKGKAVPEIMNIRKYFARRKREKAEAAETLKEVQALLSDVNNHYSATTSPSETSRCNGSMSGLRFTMSR